VEKWKGSVKIQINEDNFLAGLRRDNALIGSRMLPKNFIEVMHSHLTGRQTSGARDHSFIDTVE
jgi:hypothetical protein